MIEYLDCRRVQERLEAYVDGELALADQVHVEAHLRWCETCAARVDDYRLIGQMVRRGAQRSEEDERALTGMRIAVAARVRSDRERTFAWRWRSAFDDRRLVWPAVGATLAVVFGVGVALAVLRVAADERPESLAAMIGTLSQPGTERNPLIPIAVSSIEWARQTGRMLENRSSGGVSIPRVIDDGATFGAIPEDESEFTVAAVVNREGRVANYSVLRASQPAGRPRPGRTVASVQDAVRQSRFRPAQMPTGEAVAVNLIWVIVHQTVKGSTAVERSARPATRRVKVPVPEPLTIERPDAIDEPAAEPLAPESPTA